MLLLVKKKKYLSRKNWRGLAIKKKTKLGKSIHQCIRSRTPPVDFIWRGCTEILLLTQTHPRLIKFDFFSSSFCFLQSKLNLCNTFFFPSPANNPPPLPFVCVGGRIFWNAWISTCWHHFRLFYESVPIPTVFFFLFLLQPSPNFFPVFHISIQTRQQWANVLIYARHGPVEPETANYTSASEEDAWLCFPNLGVSISQSHSSTTFIKKTRKKKRKWPDNI